ncbi:AAA family ATPase [Mycobacterium sp. 21AC1]|uniref:AAA family ATPase n=1 Tax=[Mycobacterium] appelbergii TaxID=2939269 RepID=UPI002939502F|nr:AAA family ATPase [Mycobacterium sp. 21AC1]MDV3124763.1 AAA family ATPase [Mycobacterium sp. 21AC1]
MPDDRLKNYVLARADADVALSEQARLVVLAALESAGDLTDVLGDHETSPTVIASLTTAHDAGVEPVGAYLKDITVQGFRGIGPRARLPIPPGPGLVVIAGRNGSGKSTLAEALELALTGRNSRWHGKAAVWSSNWRNLHVGDPAEIRVGLTEQGAGTSTIGVDWPPGAEVEVDQLQQWVQRNGQKREDVGALGWAAALEMYRPLLSYDELGGILEGRPSDFYDQLYKLLGLEQLTEAVARLDVEVKRLKQPGAEVKKAKDALRSRLEQHDDERAAKALTQLKKAKPDLDAVRPLIAQGSSIAVAPAWRQAAQLTVPTGEQLELHCAALRSAASRERSEAARADALVADRARLLEQGLQFRNRHGSQPCPVCTHGTLDEKWAAAARAALERDQSAARALTAARAATRQARSAVVTAVHNIGTPPASAAELTMLAAAQKAHQRFAAMPADGDLALADHVRKHLPPLREAYAALRHEASTLIRARDDAWVPIAVQLADWVTKAEAAAKADPQLKIVTEAQKWLQANAGELRNQRIAPLADQARQIWSTLRQESNVGLGKIRLEGQKTSRRVILEAAVDGSDTEAFGVMSQGELQALALAIFIPRATSPESPFRFLVLDDPIQAMDPSKIEGFLQVLTELAADRQVIVFTHDDRLPAAIRRSRAPAHIIAVTRGAESAVTVAEASRPATRLLEDAYVIAADDAVPDAIKRAAIPVLCREALEHTAWDVFAAKSLAVGQTPGAVEAAWDEATSTRQRLLLALNPSDSAALDKWLTGGTARKATMVIVTKGIHRGLADFKLAVKQARLAVEDLRKVLP